MQVKLAEATGFETEIMDSNHTELVDKSDEKSMEESIDNCLPVIREEEKSTDSDVNSEDLNSNNEQDNNSQFYESSDSKVDYAVKLDDNDTLSDIDDIKTDTASADSEDSALGSLPPDSALTDREEDAQDRSDGSDSGLGSETTDEAKLRDFNLQCNNDERSKTPENQGRDFDHNTDSNKIEEKQDTDEVIKKPQKSNLKRKSNFEGNDEPQVKKQKHNIHFDNITVYYFPRAQGFSCVPSQGGSTLGMEWEHSHVQTFTLTEHALEQKRLHRQVLQQLKSERHNLQGVSLSSSEDSDTEEETSDISESELDLDSYYFLQPVPTRQRRALLRAAGVRKIEGYEKDECRDIRTSREFCGCACKGVCNPENCLCSMSGIKCQVDRLNFPCGCTRDGCGNKTGRIEFNPMRVRTHFINTLMRLGLEKKNEEAQEAVKRKWAEAQNNISSTCASNSSYEKENCHNQENNLISNTNSTPRIGLESCINTVGYSGIHHNMNNIPSNNQNHETSYNYRNDQTDHRIIKTNNMMNFQGKSSHGNHDYTSNILQGKGPPYPPTGMDFNMSNSMQRYPDPNYSYDQQHSDGHLFKGIHSFPAASFEEFAHNSQMTMLNHYGHMYVPEYLHKPNTSMPDHNMQYHMMQQNHYDMYKNTENVNMDNKTNAHYSNLLSMPYQQSNKLQAIENDENWFSHNTLLNLDHSVQVTQEVPIENSEVTPPLVESDASEATENFGELIKKTMVESVTV